MSKDLFRRTRSLLQDHVRILNEYRIGDTHTEEAELLIAEIDLSMTKETTRQHMLFSRYVPKVLQPPWLVGGCLSSGCLVAWVREWVRVCVGA